MKYKSLIQNMIQQVRLVKDKNFPLDADILLEQSLFPSQPYQQGDVK